MDNNYYLKQAKWVLTILLILFFVASNVNAELGSKVLLILISVSILYTSLAIWNWIKKKFKSPQRSHTESKLTSGSRGSASHTSIQQHSKKVQESVHQEQRNEGLNKAISFSNYSHHDSAINKSQSSTLPSLSRLVVHKMRKDLHTYVSVDIETTGLHAPSDKVIQLSAVKYVDDKQVSAFNTFINPGSDKLPLSTFTSSFTGIHTSDVAQAPTLDEVKYKFLEFVDDLPWIGHNIYKFDIPFLYKSNIGRFEYYAEDTYALAKRKLNRLVLGNLRLPTLKKYYGINNQSHNALNDCITTALVYQHLRDDRINHYLTLQDKATNSLKGLHFMVIGDFPEMNKNQLITQIERRSGIVDKRWSHKTDYLVNGITTKNYKSVELARKNKTVFLNYSDFLNLLNSFDEAMDNTSKRD